MVSIIGCYSTMLDIFPSLTRFNLCRAWGLFHITNSKNRFDSSISYIVSLYHLYYVFSPYILKHQTRKITVETKITLVEFWFYTQFHYFHTTRFQFWKGIGISVWFGEIYWYVAMLVGAQCQWVGARVPEYGIPRTKRREYTNDIFIPSFQIYIYVFGIWCCAT